MVFHQIRSGVYQPVDGRNYYSSPIPNCKLEILAKYVLVIDNECGDEDDDVIDYHHAVESKMPVDEQ